MDDLINCKPTYYSFKSADEREYIKRLANEMGEDFIGSNQAKKWHIECSYEANNRAFLEHLIDSFTSQFSDDDPNDWIDADGNTFGTMPNYTLLDDEENEQSRPSSIKPIESTSYRDESTLDHAQIIEQDILDEILTEQLNAYVRRMMPPSNITPLPNTPQSFKLALIQKRIEFQMSLTTKWLKHTQTICEGAHRATNDAVLEKAIEWCKSNQNRIDTQHGLDLIPQTQNALIPIKTNNDKPLEHAQICLIELYNQRPITKLNKDEVAVRYGLMTPNAGKVLLKKYNELDNEGPRLARNKTEKDIETILSRLSGSALERAQGELIKIKNKRY